MTMSKSSDWLGNTLCTMKFSTTLKQTGTNTTGIVVPPEVVESLGPGKKPKVNVTLNGFTLSQQRGGDGWRVF